MTSKMVVCGKLYWLKDEALRRVIKNAVKMCPFACHASPSFCGNNLETAERLLTNIGASEEHKLSR
jgi:hypothetical protein